MLNGDTFLDLHKNLLLFRQFATYFLIHHKNLFF